VLQCVPVCCSVLQCVAVCCSVLQCIHRGYSDLFTLAPHTGFRPVFSMCCSVLQCGALCCSVLQLAAACCSVLQCIHRVIRSHHTLTQDAAQFFEFVALCCSVMQCIHMNSSVLSQTLTPYRLQPSFLNTHIRKVKNSVWSMFFSISQVKLCFESEVQMFWYL